MMQVIFSGELRVVEQGRSRVVAVRRDLALLLWGGGVSVEEATSFAQSVRRELGTAPRAATLVWLTGLPASRPTDPVRQVLARAISLSPPTFVGLAYAVEAVGFGSSIARSVITGLNLDARPTLPVRVHGEPADAVAWLGEQLHWSSALVASVGRGLVDLRTTWAATGGTPLPSEQRGDHDEKTGRREGGKAGRSGRE
jgi:hypothetical protein